MKYINTLMKTTFMIIKHAHEKYRAPRHNGNRYQKKPKLGYDLKKGKINSLSFKSLNANTKTFWWTYNQYSKKAQAEYYN